MQTVSRPAREFSPKLIGVAIKVGNEGEHQWIIDGGQTVSCMNVPEGLVVQDNESPKVQPRKLTKGNQRVPRIHPSRRHIHGGEQIS